MICSDSMRSGLSFDDVLLVPKRTSARSRRLVDISTRVTSGIPLRLPVLSANTPWCTQAEMASAMAMAGGMGVVHRMQTPQQQADEVRCVKSVSMSKHDCPDASLDQADRLRVGAAVGVKGDYLERSELLVAAGVDLILIDVAHGHADHVLEAITKIKARFPLVPLVAGNVATSEGTRDLISAGTAAVKVGIGPGGICTTRLVTGCGVPQLTAIMDCAIEARKYDIPIIADGGIRTSGDATKALAAGASTVMLGSMLAGTEESAASLVERNGVKWKITTGFATLGMELTLKRCSGETITRNELDQYVPEGVEATYPYKGPLALELQKFVGGLRSGMSYCGAMSIPELWAKAEFIKVSLAGLAENRPHAADEVPLMHPDYAEMIT